MKKLLRIILIVVIAAVALIGQRWYSYVTNMTDPFDEVGINLQSYMPAPLRHWGCMQLKQNFGNKTLPPYGCQSPDSGTKWVD
ncbi:hypothetical protein [Pseudochrobactrum kiredjianiae]|uniref:Uncharacterized protein n=1 Tax=Pseudochrobactrum kiredjianiae TaxID=386305 RepID=A0ABW3V2R6_9HYPH|nr:hypothetical protein [Pseudochrobactrum kiredjianiae]MDM7852888.1 hypothetical protein [Pseudochrobactrum kiredjianiae]